MKRPLNYRERHPRSRPNVGEPDLMPGLRERLVCELDRCGVAPSERVKYLGADTGRALQSVMRWLSLDTPGLPDLRSLAILCLRLEVDANWMLGLVRSRRPFPAESVQEVLRGWLPRSPSPDWTGRLDFHMDSLAQGYAVYMMKGDDMAPLISDGMPMLVDTSVSQFAGNGIYFLTLGGRSMVRNVELSADQRMLLHCANERYRALTIEAVEGIAPALEVIGKVRMAFELRRF